MSHLHGVRDLLSLGSCCKAAQEFLCDRDWPSVKCLRLRRAMPMPTSLEWILARCSSIHDIDASGCGQFSDNVLLALSDLPIKVSLRARQKQPSANLCACTSAACGREPVVCVCDANYRAFPSSSMEGQMLQLFLISDKKINGI